MLLGVPAVSIAQSVSTRLADLDQRILRLMAPVADAKPRASDSVGRPESMIPTLNSGGNTVPMVKVKSTESIGQFGSGTYCFKDPTGLLVDARWLMVVDSGNRRIVRLSHRLDQWSDYRPIQDGVVAWAMPHGIAPSGRYWVLTDVQSHELVVVNDSGELVQRVGEWGIQGGKFDTPVAVVRHPNRKWIVVDQGNRRVQIFSDSWQFDSEIGLAHPVAGPLKRPVDVAVSVSGLIWVADRDRLRGYSETGQWLQDIAGPFQSISAVAIDASGRFFVSDVDANRVWILAPSGQVLGSVEVSRPTDIAIWGHWVFVIDSARSQICRIQLEF